MVCNFTEALLNIIPLPALLSCSLESISPVGLRNRPRIVSQSCALAPKLKVEMEGKPASGPGWIPWALPPSASGVSILWCGADSPAGFIAGKKSLSGEERVKLGSV